jgi:hypothetical protein
LTSTGVKIVQGDAPTSEKLAKQLWDLHEDVDQGYLDIAPGLLKLEKLLDKANPSDLLPGGAALPSQSPWYAITALKKSLRANLTSSTDINKFNTLVKPGPKTVKVTTGNQSLIQTALGPLDNALAKSVYNKMKADMPGATPAVWRKAAADYLGVDYKDYLLAWKQKPGSGAPKPPAPASLPPKATGTVTKSTGGKYAEAITNDQLVDELAKLYGPQANKQYIAVSRTGDGEFTTTFPSSILDDAGKAAVVEGLKKLGLKVTKSGTTYKIVPKDKKDADPDDLHIDVNGTQVLNEGPADKWTEKWWKTLTTAEQNAWEHYTSSGYDSINRAYRHDKVASLSDYQLRVSRLLSKTMQKAEETFTVQRGGRYTLSDFKKGALWSDKGFTSTAIRGSGFGGNVKMVITVTKGTQGMYIGKRSSHPGEKEWLLNKGTKFRVTKIEGSTVYLTTIP